MQANLLEDGDEDYAMPNSPRSPQPMLPQGRSLNPQGPQGERAAGKYVVGDADSDDEDIVYAKADDGASTPPTAAEVQCGAVWRSVVQCGAVQCFVRVASQGNLLT